MKKEKNTVTKRKHYTSMKPKMKTSYNDKVKDDKEWYKDCIDYFTSQSRFRHSREFSQIEELYRIYNNLIPENLFDYVTNPLNSKNQDHQYYPAKIKPFNILRTTIDQFLGEFKNRPANFMVTVNNPDASTMMFDKQYEVLLENLKQLFVNEAKKQGKDLGAEDEVQPPEKFEEYFNHEYKDERAVQGQYALKLINDTAYLQEKFNDNFLHWVIAGEAYTYKEVLREDVNYKVVNPLDFDYDRNTETKFVEDGEWACHIQFPSLSDVVDMFYDELEEDQIEELEKRTKKGGLHRSISDTDYERRMGSSFYNWNTVELIHCTWKAFTKIGILSYMSEIGQVEFTEVSEDYKLNVELGDIEIEWLWITEVHEGYRIDTDIYLRMRAIPYQRNQVNQLSSCKLPYNGKRYSNINAPNISVMKLGLPYQILYIIVMYQIELMLGKNKGHIVMIDKSLIPTTGDWDEEKFMYYAEALGYAFVDGSKARNMNINQVLQTSTIQHIGELIKVAEFYKNEFKNLLGITPQREGQINSSDSVGGTNASISQSYTISEEIFANYEELLERDLQGLLDLSKFAWINGKKAMMVSNDMRNQLLEIEPEKYAEIDFGVMVTKNAKELQTLQTLKQNAQAFAQNGSSPETVLEIIHSQNVSELRNKLKDVAAKMEKQMEQQSKSAEQLEQQKLEIQKQLAEMQHQYDVAIENMITEREMALADKKGQYEVAKYSMNEPVDMNADGAIDESELAKYRVEKEKMTATLISGEKDRALKAQEIVVKAKTEMAKLDNKIEVEKIKSKTALKNKVVGQK